MAKILKMPKRERAEDAGGTKLPELLESAQEEQSAGLRFPTPPGRSQKFSDTTSRKRHPNTTSPSAASSKPNRNPTDGALPTGRALIGGVFHKIGC
jgi:hypothetical protein